MTSQAVSVVLQGERTGLPDSTLLCYVELRGNVVFSGPRGVTVAYPRAYEVFDAHTGNLLGWGGMN
jgi:hypothetical protein